MKYGKTEKCMKIKHIAATSLLLAVALEGGAVTAPVASADDGWPQAYVWATGVRVHNNPDTSSADIVGTVSQVLGADRMPKAGAQRHQRQVQQRLVDVRGNPGRARRDGLDQQRLHHRSGETIVDPGLRLLNAPPITPGNHHHNPTRTIPCHSLNSPTASPARPPQLAL
jgi:hypothetical protein